MPGGVNSPARAWGSVGGSPIVLDNGKGSRINDIDGNTYIDYVCSWGPMILGHAHDEILNAANKAMNNGTSFGAPTSLEITMAEMVVDAISSIEMVRFVNSGTEAVMSALRLARAHTGRNIILKFDGGYHGHDDALLVRSGSGLANQGIASSSGVHPDYAAGTLVANYNDLDSVTGLMEAYRNEVAAVIIEPIAGNMGIVESNSDFLKNLRDICDQNGSLLIFDEVISGFRVSYGGAQSIYGVYPDITCLGKIIGGGFPVGAYGASSEVMRNVAPLGSMYQAGTLSGNPVAMAAGIKTLELLKKPGTYNKLSSITNDLANGIRSIFAEARILVQVNSVCGALTLFFNPDPVTDMKGATACDMDGFARFFHFMANRGIYLPPSQYEAWFISLAHSSEDIDDTLHAISEYVYQ